MESSEIGIFRRRINHDAKVRLFCFPYAGGSSAIFYRWSEYVSPAVEVCSVQLPGREGRLTMLPYTSMRPLVQAVGNAILPFLDKPYVLFGHSLGGLIAFELARYLHDLGVTRPLSLLVSAADAPHLGRTTDRLHALPDDELIGQLSLLRGTPQEILQHPEVMQLLLPTIRADLQVFETYAYRAGSPLPCPIAVFGGIDDKRVELSGLENWRHHSRTGFSLTMLPGDHFFIHSACRALVERIGSHLETVLDEVDLGEDCAATEPL
jgi:medium-chain acyl-[acyl-carrier-protein] hydrolase